MTGLSLTTERRNELAALLDDDQRLRTEFPKVADYLDTAPMLKGTGDAAADAAFDLRFVHFMTGGESADPYWDIVGPAVAADGDRRVVNGGRVWHPVGDLAEFAGEPQSECVLFLCWPPGWGDPMASRALHAFEQAGGGRLIFIGEPKGGKTGDDAFFDQLATSWSLEKQDPHHVSWWNLGDIAQGWIRRK
ncbi:hypothetical protein ACQPW1_13510 [Nocardia sp. CA-128927]|uniref:hypothetical protein n=1 Tax=Nocardia sp. CA-128927 TaxID=3239975 RepID=UPI003D99ABC6